MSLLLKKMKALEAGYTITMPADSGDLDQTGAFETCWVGISLASSGYAFFYDDVLDPTSQGDWVTPRADAADLYCRYVVISEDTVWGVDREGDIDNTWGTQGNGVIVRIKDTVVAGSKFCTLRIDVSTSADAADIIAQQTYTLTADKTS